STRSTGKASATSTGRAASSLAGKGSSPGTRRTANKCEPCEAIVARNESGVFPPFGIGPTTCAEPGTGAPSTSNSAVRVAASGPALVIVVLTEIGRFGEASPRASSSGPTAASAPSGFASAPKARDQILGGTGRR